MSWGLNEEGDHIEVPEPLPVVKETFREKVDCKRGGFPVDAGSLPLFHERLYFWIQLCVVGLGALGA